VINCTYKWIHKFRLTTLSFICLGILGLLFFYWSKWPYKEGVFFFIAIFLINVILDLRTSKNLVSISADSKQLKIGKESIPLSEVKLCENFYYKPVGPNCDLATKYMANGTLIKTQNKDAILLSFASNYNELIDHLKKQSYKILHKRYNKQRQRINR